MVCIAYYTVLNVQICNYVQKQRICRENSKRALDKSLYGHFALVERLPTSATLVLGKRKAWDTWASDGNEKGRNKREW